jgi:hypothetical protein
VEIAPLAIRIVQPKGNKSRQDDKKTGSSGHERFVDFMDVHPKSKPISVL